MNQPFALRGLRGGVGDIGLLALRIFLQAGLCHGFFQLRGQRRLFRGALGAGDGLGVENIFRKTRANAIHHALPGGLFNLVNGCFQVFDAQVTGIAGLEAEDGKLRDGGHFPLLAGGEDGHHGVIVAARDGVELVIVAARAAERYAQKSVARGIHHIGQPFVADLVALQRGFVVDGSDGIDAGRDFGGKVIELFLRRIEAAGKIEVIGPEFIAGDLFLYEAVVRLVFVQR